MTGLDMIVDNKDNGNFHLEENFHLFVTVGNQGISGAGGGIGSHFFATYNESISVSLACL